MERKAAYLKGKLPPEEIDEVMQRLQAQPVVSQPNPPQSSNLFGLVGLAIIGLVGGGLFFVRET